MSYKAALQPTKTNPSTNVPIHCQICPPLAISGDLRTIWKYNAIYHILSEHSEGQYTGSLMENAPLPKIPGQMMVDMFISQCEEVLLKILPDCTKEHRQRYGIPNSDDLEVIKEDLKRERAQTLSITEPTGKRRRK